MNEHIQKTTTGKGLIEITSDVEEAIDLDSATEGLCTIFLKHTSASLLIQENAAPSAKRDLENWFNRLVEEGDPLFTHTAEGPDDMPSHIKAALTNTSLNIPIVEGELALGTWQGIFLWEHRTAGKTRNIVIHV
jgi:secondary thiamine-phosphate synthase enzyme